ncbi:ArsR/SmtB family transcription factor [Allorhizocola rhizosphaerae]|uniref:ArsR/SmtB family transcription factor n=1 Tax=Allorhizocola rhizosphaerae TaxID=1872709 RepID=UPI000E3BF1FA|nr:helix-turn-helix domain-containing protein [Allorhizocola rhizosphaerae]
MLRIHFTAQDLARVTIAAEPDPLWEMLLSLHLMQGQDGELVYGPWRGQVRASVPAAEMRLLCELAPPSGYSPDFLTPVGSGPAFDTAVDRLMATPRSRVQADLRNLASRQAPTEWTRSLASGSPTAMRRLGQAMRSYYGKALRPYWRSIRQHVVADRARRVAELATLGIDHVLATLHPGIRWEPPVLQITEFADHDVFSSFPQRPSPEQSHHLDGRGLLLQPSFFCRHAPTKLPDTGLPPVLVYPTQPPPGTLQRQQNPARPSSLESLMGRTRAIALEATVSGCTTSALARVCGISVGAASQQATVLRDANLITTRRQGLAVLHEITPLGLDLLTAATIRP